jgi:hypothetical protein
MSVNNREESPQDMVGLPQELGIIAIIYTFQDVRMSYQTRPLSRPPLTYPFI